MLVTICTHCQSRFRVTPQQLNEKQGQVRCGRCHRVLLGFEALERFPDDDTGARLLAQREAEEHGLPAPPPVEHSPEEELPEIESVGTAPPIPVDLPMAPDTQPSYATEAPAAPAPFTRERPARRQ